MTHTHALNCKGLLTENWVWGWAMDHNPEHGAVDLVEVGAWGQARTPTASTMKRTVCLGVIRGDQVGSCIASHDDDPLPCADCTCVCFG